MVRWPDFSKGEAYPTFIHPTCPKKPPLTVEEGAAALATVLGMGQAIADRYENCWHCGATNIAHTSDEDHCGTCFAVLAYR